ncbi:Transcriptional corepressor SEUSS [Musa troglodytarum]|uniref:HVA22-like protein n=1 Tax=Musa troglodytarum TaxID=320322 RepID=A0A9E7IK20_9LILI|nr:Transcriptional corepressor SEUSS [Musa troglodytarum]
MSAATRALPDSLIRPSSRLRRRIPVANTRERGGRTNTERDEAIALPLYCYSSHASILGTSINTIPLRIPRSPSLSLVRASKAAIMMGSFLSRGLILVFGYAYPAYECYKTVELNKPEIEQLLFWCQYWILVASLAILERFVDVLFSWLPMYCEAKLALYIYLWYPKMRGTTFVYGTFVRPYIAKHENEIDRHLLEFRTRVADIMLMYWQKATGYGRISFFDVLNRVALLLQASRTHPSQA